MGSYLSEGAAQEAIEQLVQEYTQDYIVYVVKRTRKTSVTKTVVYGVKVKQQSFNEKLFNDFMEHEIKNDQKLQIAESEIFVENSTLKELFLIKASVVNLV